MCREFVITTLAASLLLLSISPPTSAQNSPPNAPVREVIDEYFGLKVSDPYRWMENSKDPETVAWMKAQADYARDYLSHLPLRQQLLERINKLSDAGIEVNGIQLRGNLYFYYRLAPGENDRRVYLRGGLEGPEHLLIDPEKISQPGKRYSIDQFNASLDGQYVSYRVSAGGSENGEIRVVETATGKDMGERIDRAREDAGYWLPDGKSFLYNRTKNFQTARRQPSCIRKAVSIYTGSVQIRQQIERFSATKSARTSSLNLLLFLTHLFRVARDTSSPLSIRAFHRTRSTT
jgi:prolyl oligopeptidase